ncbi:AAA family ATPase [Paenibacillus whitsoniae]|uniref:AAA family ATPase n=1 Tax=Paenibacillus whitsoniae TaxID=2496558 RepID=A0A3S0BQL8_9BACL|nr:AAA family ATPase [Paenibacillus whitsoniae]RTE02774.1 AAA family ATPase [Paenibacillus whitsoniae]
MFLRSMTLLKEKVTDRQSHPFTIPAIRGFERLDFKHPVTFFVGENGSGKSTLLEAIADQCGFNLGGGGRNNVYDVDASQSALGNFIRLSWLPRVTQGFFLRAESFYHFASHLDQLAREDPTFRYQAYGGKSLHQQSHGESFLSLFINRFGGGKGIYLLDEPEAALSPARQLAFLRIMHGLVKGGKSQFIIATHSPILLGFPGAHIYSFDSSAVERISYEETEHYQITKSFLNRTDKFLEDLFRDEE